MSLFLSMKAFPLFNGKFAIDFCIAHMLSDDID